MAKLGNPRDSAAGAVGLHTTVNMLDTPSPGVYCRDSAAPCHVTLILEINICQVLFRHAADASYISRHVQDNSAPLAAHPPLPCLGLSIMRSLGWLGWLG